ncbi:hypothetical protein HQ447_16840, partial [bacterium]|nr:hypothetical protein [bacterium]
ALILVAALCVISWKRSPHPKRSAALETLRFLVTLAVVILLWQPEWLTTLHPDTKPQIAILWDDSKSMTTLDAALPSGLSEKSQVVSRAEWVKKALTSDLWKPLEANGANEVSSSSFSSPSTINSQPSTSSGTDLDSPLTELLAKQNNLRAVVMLSDGDYNLGPPPVAAAQKLRLRGVPLFAIPVGSKVRLPDLDLLSVTAPTYGIVGENVQIPFTIRSSLDRQVRTVVRLRDESGKERTKNIVIPPNSETYDSILWRLEKEGSSTLDLSIPVADGELVATNNSRKFAIAGRPEKIRVLLIETLPRWEYRYLRNALSRDPGVELSCLLFHPALGPGEGKDYLNEFPAKIEDLAKYDVIFIGDVGTEQLTKEQCALIRGLVENQASGLIFMPGSQGNQFSLLDTELSDLIPVLLDDSNRKGMAESLPSPLTLTTEGRASLLTMLGNSEEENPEIWRRLPGFYWHAPVIKAKGGAEVLAVHGNRRGKYGPIPLLVTKPAGSGKVLFMGIDSAWRWRRGVEDLYHYRFWGQVARWMSYQRNMASGQRVRLFFNPERPEPGSTVTLNANAFDPNGAPLKEGTVSVDLTAPDGRTQRIELQKNETAWGAFSGRFKIDLPGAWKVRATATGAEDKPLETTILAQGVEIEKTGQPARPEVLEEMAKVSKGRVIQPAQLAELIQEITALPAPQPQENRIPLWSHWATVAALVTLLGIFWIGRKLNGAF